jgi:hypothetical protein
MVTLGPKIHVTPDKNLHGHATMQLHYFYNHVNTKVLDAVEAYKEIQINTHNRRMNIPDGQHLLPFTQQLLIIVEKLSVSTVIPDYSDQPTNIIVPIVYNRQ